ncbi:hypothetical protein [Streptomyces natalensis]|uniref:Uncharacterized protein n=1 Tax=Streptomyces natalensis ATCC 27448 TaxID=1240678 RepID=A0A0D7CHU2_9ACTN|nr:hypothetical protein [Streptomyces natalensis]KIZ15819.1 hypothetical protein SNA_21185 [Streptomyces natalensis ATCC 27448]
MDEGTAALIVGIMAAASAVLAFFGGKMGAKIGADALRKQVDDQAKNEYAHWVRRERRQIFGETLRAYSQLAQTLTKLRIAIHEDETTDQLIEAAVEERALLHISCYNTRLLGPASVHEAAVQLSEAAQTGVEAHKAVAFLAVNGNAIQRADALRDLSAARNEMGSHLTSFTRASREVLLEPPTVE